MDINTIFYFPSSLTFEEYSNKLNQGEISERTIVFADAQKSIYKGGKKYGGTSVLEFHNLIDTLYDDSWISDEIGGIKGSIIGLIARLDRFDTLVTNVSSRLDDEILNRDNNIQEKVEELMQDASWLQENFPQGVTSWDANWNLELEAYLQTVGYWTTDGNGLPITQWSKLQQQLNSVESSVNSLKVDGNLTLALTTSIQQLITDKIAQLQLGTTYATVEKVDDVETVLEWMYSGLQSSASEDTTFSEMSSMAKNDFVSAISDIRTQVDKVANGDFVAQTELASKVGDTIATMLLQSASNNALAGLAARLDLADAENAQNISALILGITNSSSTADIATSVGNVLSGFASSSTVSSDIASAKSEIYSAIGAKDTNDNFISIASLKTSVDEHTSQISGLASTADVSAGYVAKADLDGAVAEMFASSGNGQNATAKANIIALVKDNKSELELTAQDINITAADLNITAESIDIDGYLTAGDASFKGDVEANKFQTGASNEYGVCVITDTFDELAANKKKAYFGYDSDQGGVTMWFYQGGEWKRLNLADSAVTNDPDAFRTDTFYNITDLSIKTIPNNLPSVTLYYNRALDKYYNSTSTADPASGTYYSINGYLNGGGYLAMFNDIPSESKQSHITNGTGCGVVREIREDGTITYSGLCSETTGRNKHYNIDEITITNGKAEVTGTASAVVAVRDVYIDSNNEVKKVVVAPVIVTPSPVTGMPSTDGSVFQRYRYYNAYTSRWEYVSTNLVTLAGDIIPADMEMINEYKYGANDGYYAGKGFGGARGVTYIPSTLANALATEEKSKYSSLDFSYHSFSASQNAAVVYPGIDGANGTDINYPLPYATLIPSYTLAKFHKL